MKEDEGGGGGGGNTAMPTPPLAPCTNKTLATGWDENREEGGKEEGRAAPADGAWRHDRHTAGGECLLSQRAVCVCVCAVRVVCVYLVSGIRIAATSRTAGW